MRALAATDNDILLLRATNGTLAVVSTDGRQIDTEDDDHAVYVFTEAATLVGSGVLATLDNGSVWVLSECAKSLHSFVDVHNDRLPLYGAPTTVAGAIASIARDTKLTFLRAYASVGAMATAIVNHKRKLACAVIECRGRIA